MLAFKDARLSVVEYDHNSHDLKTISLHYFETQDLKVWMLGGVDGCTNCSVLATIHFNLILISNCSSYCS